MTARALAIVLAALLAAGPARAQAPAPPSAAPVYNASDPAPAISSELTWAHDGVSAPGWWFSKAQVIKLDARLTYLEDQAARDCITATNAATKADLGSPAAWWLALAIGLVAGGVGGYFVRKAVR